jgi:hypothetical protein
MHLSLDSRVKPARYVVHGQLDAGLVLLDMRTANCFELDEVGATIWSACREHGHIREGIRRVASRYEVEPRDLEGDVLALVNELMDLGLLELCS